MPAPRDYYRYELYDQGKIIYIGITNDPQRREEEHQAEGKKFRTMSIRGPAVSKATAERWEEKRLASFRNNHRGRNPKYNKQSR